MTLPVALTVYSPLIRNAGMSKRPKQIVLAGVSTILSLVIAEGAVRIICPAVSRENFTAVPGTIATHSPFPEAPYVLRRNAVAVQEFGSDRRGYFDDGGTLTYRTNSLGIRGPETTQKKPESVYRIIGLGDSFTFGTGVRFEHTFLHLLEEILNERDDTPRTEVLNFGVPGWNTSAEVALLKNRGPLFEPDEVLLCFF